MLRDYQWMVLAERGNKNSIVYNANNNNKRAVFGYMAERARNWLLLIIVESVVLDSEVVSESWGLNCHE